MDSESSTAHTSKLTSADERLFNKPKKNLIQLLDFVGAVKNSLNDTNSSGCSENEGVNENDQTNAVVAGMCICILSDY